MPWVAALAAVAGTVMQRMDANSMKNQAADAELKRQQRIREGTADVDSAFAGYNPEFYKKRENAYLQFALPQEQSQFNEAQKQTMFGLAGRGLLGGSAAKNAMSNLYRTHASAQQGIGDEAVNQANTLKTNVSQSRQGVLDQLYQSADPGRAKDAAVSAASQYQMPNAFAPLTNLFSNISNQYLANQALTSFKKGVSYSSPEDNKNPLAAALGSFTPTIS